MPEFGVGVHVETLGPLFDKDAKGVVERWLEKGVQRIVELGEQRLDLMLRPRPAGVFLSVAEAKPGKASTGNYRRNVHGRVSNLEGILTDGGVVYGPWLEGTSRRNQTTRFKGYGVFRKTRTWIEKHVAPKVLDDVARKAAAELGG